MKTPITYYQIPEQCRAEITYDTGKVKKFRASISVPGTIEKLVESGTVDREPTIYTSMEELKEDNVVYVELINTYPIDKSDIDHLIEHLPY